MRIAHQVSIRIMFASKQGSQVLKHFEIHGKTFTVQAKTTKGLALKHFAIVLYIQYNMSMSM